jgi:hypothetical protein
MDLASLLVLRGVWRDKKNSSPPLVTVGTAKRRVPSAVQSYQYLAALYGHRKLSAEVRRFLTVESISSVCMDKEAPGRQGHGSTT